ncbi:MAG: MerR family transcriptional regulator [Oscillospiraceae bacterium]|nr:MerR family transcriptional regulator [Oscillospiraceae bacterium]
MTIGEFSKLTGISCSALRYYEEKGLIRVGRDGGNRREYSEKDTEWIKFLQKLKNTGMNLGDMKGYSDLRYEGETTVSERLELLEKHRAYVDGQTAKWREYSQNLNAKIELYREMLRRQK